MKAFEFETNLTLNRTVELPAELKAQIAPGSSMRVILLLPEVNEESDWKQLTAEQFLKGYAERDSVYDNL